MMTQVVLHFYVPGIGYGVFMGRASDALYNALFDSLSRLSPAKDVSEVPVRLRSYFRQGYRVCDQKTSYRADWDAMLNLADKCGNRHIEAHSDATFSPGRVDEGSLRNLIGDCIGIMLVDRSFFKPEFPVPREFERILSNIVIPKPICPLPRVV